VRRLSAPRGYFHALQEAKKSCLCANLSSFAKNSLTYKTKRIQEAKNLKWDIFNFANTSGEMEKVCRFLTFIKINSHTAAMKDLNARV
jgi:hypothetical protein